jgi:hypothetical protein
MLARRATKRGGCFIAENLGMPVQVNPSGGRVEVLDLQDDTEAVVDEAVEAFEHTEVVAILLHTMCSAAALRSVIN